MSATQVDRSGYVYVLKAHKPFEACFKVGRTNNLGRRLHDFGVKLPYKVELVYSWRTNDCYRDESYVHDALLYERLEGEWFKLAEADLAWIRLYGLAAEAYSLAGTMHKKLEEVAALVAYEDIARYQKILKIQARVVRRFLRRHEAERYANSLFPE